MKEKVIAFFQNLPEAKHEQFNEAYALYRESANKNLAYERALNAQGFTASGLDNLMYDLQKMYGISDSEKLLRVKKEEVKLPSELETLRSDNEELQSVKEELESEKEDLEFENLDLKDENEGLKSEIELLKTSPKLDAKAIRVEFPFLNEKDCPNELKILVADKITAWNRYVELHAEIVKLEAGEITATDDEKTKLAAEAVECFDENQKIYDELNCYQKTGKVLGAHPIFKKLQIEREVDEMTNDELIKYRTSSAKYFSVKKTELAKAKKEKDDVKTLKIETGIAERSEKLFLVNKKLGV